MHFRKVAITRLGVKRVCFCPVQPAFLNVLLYMIQCFSRAPRNRQFVYG